MSQDLVQDPAEMHSNRRPHIEWDDLRYVLAVAEHGSLAAAARVLAVNHTTVLRRIQAFELQHGVRLFDRLASGYALTQGGEELLEAARQMQATMDQLQRRLAGQDLRLEGLLRITTADTLMASLLPGLLAAFRALHPGIQLEVSVTNAIADLTRRDADVAIRPAADPPESLVGRRICNLGFAVYGSEAYVAARSPEQEFAADRWVAPDERLAGSVVARWMRTQLPDAEIVLRADSLVTLRQAAVAGAGLAVLPCYLGDLSAGLVRVGGVLPGVSTPLWLLTHEDLRQTARVRAFTEFAAEALEQKRALLEG